MSAESAGRWGNLLSSASRSGYFNQERLGFFDDLFTSWLALMWLSFISIN